MTDIRATWYLTNSEEVTEWKICVTRLPSQKAWRLSEIRRTKCLVFGRGLQFFRPIKLLHLPQLINLRANRRKKMILVGIELLFYLQYIVVKIESFVRAAFWAGKFVCTVFFSTRVGNIRLVFCKENPSSWLTGMHGVKTYTLNLGYNGVANPLESFAIHRVRYNHRGSRWICPDKSFVISRISLYHGSLEPGFTIITICGLYVFPLVMLYLQVNGR